MRRLQLREEELIVDKHVVQLGLVRIRRRFITETRTIEVPVTREEISIERLPGGSSAEASPDTSLVDSDAPHHLRERLRTLQPGETICVPIVEEEVLVQKRAVVTQELVIHKRQVQEIRKVSETVKREALRLAQSGEVQVRVEGAVAHGSADASQPAEIRTVKRRAKRPPSDRAEQPEQRIELREEELSVGKQVVDVGAIHVSTGVISEQQSVVVRLAREEVLVEQRPVEPRPAEVGLDTGGTVLEVPEYGEQISVDKVPMVVEEIAIRSEVTQAVQQVRTSVQREELRIETEGAVEVRGAGRGGRRRPPRAGPRA